MNIKTIEDALRDYKRKKSVIETTRERIKVFKRALEHPEENWEVYLWPSIDITMPRKQGGYKESTVEHAALEGEKKYRRLKEWIKDDKSRIYPLEIEVKQLEGALNALTEQQRYIIECKYFEDMFWKEIEISYNNTFSQQNYISQEGLRKVNREALELLSEILEPYYNRFKTA